MNSFQLNLKTYLKRTATYYPEKEIISKETDGSLFRYNYAQFYERTKRLANVLKRLGIKKGDNVASLAWNTHRHLELYFGVPCYGATLHTVNIRYGEPEIIYTINHAEDEIIFFDKEQLPIIEKVAPKLNTIKAFIILDKEVPHDTSLSPIYAYEELIKEEESDYIFEDLEENTPASICYTSATTGLPKGVVYSHRSICLHASALCFKDVMALSEHDSILPIVPMFHATSWGLPYAAVLLGATLVLPGTRPKTEDVLALIESQKVTYSAAAVTIGIDMLRILESKSYDISSLRELLLGGQAIPKTVIEKFKTHYSLPLVQAFGATETSPIVTFFHVRKDQENMSENAINELRSRQGIVLPGIDMKIVNEDGKEIPWDDNEMGEIVVRGPWIVEEYYKDERSSFENGWWKSGDIATINNKGAIRIVDRDKDVIKSGGEWISSIQLEHEIMAHPSINEACVVSMPHEKWLERPLAYISLKETHPDTNHLEEELNVYLSTKFPKWWLPDKYVIIDEIPKNANGKYNKKLLKERAKSFV